MELYAAGFNAWGQLDFGNSAKNGNADLQDLRSFQNVLTDKSRIGRPHSLLSSTHIETSSGPLSAGFASAFSQSPVLRQQLLTSTLAIAGNERVAVIASKPPNTTVILQYTSLDELQRGSAPEQTSAISHLGDEYSGSRITQKLVAYETGFALLAADGCVYTWGDERYAACLGREVTGSTPAEKPARVEDLVDLPTGPIRTIAAGGYTLMAVTKGNDLYAWGGHPGRPALLPDISEIPIPIDVHEEDVVDCGVGEHHAIVLTPDGRVFITGDNTNGQLGISEPSMTQSWKQITLPDVALQSVVGVEAGGRTSFILVRHGVS